MATEENLGKKIDQIDKNAQYDSCAKRLLAEKIVLAYILKYSVSEFESYSIEDIRNYYIEGVEIACRGVDTDESGVNIIASNEGSAIRGGNVESVTKTEGKVIYDIIFDAIVPSTKIPIQLIINVEAQKSDPEEYEMVTRGVYYCSRLISAQKGTVFNKSEYQKLRKVYSIWICMNPKEDRRNTMNVYANQEHNIIGSFKANKKSYDLSAVVILNLDPKNKDDKPTILDFLEVLLSSKTEPAEKKQILLDAYGVETTPAMDKEMNEMCDLSKGIAEENREEGRAEGRVEGKILGAIETYRDLGLKDSDIIAKIVSRYHLTEAQAESYMAEAQCTLV